MIQNQGCFQTKGCAILEQYETRKRRKGIKIIGGILLISFMLGIFLSAGGSSTPSEEYLAVLHIEGTMSENDGYTYDQQYAENPYGAQYVEMPYNPQYAEDPDAQQPVDPNYYG